MSIQGGSETYQECLLMKCRAVTNSKCEMRRRAWRASDMRQEMTCFTCCFVFTPLFLPILCARDGFVDTPPASREEAKMRRISQGQIWSIQATWENACTEKALISNTFSNFLIFEFSIQSNSFRLGQEAWRFYWNRMTSIPNIQNGTLFRRIPLWKSEQEAWIT